jgi:hypothetical protein
MARPIKDTPILTGKAAIKFLSDMNKMKEKKITPEAFDKMKTNAEKLRSISKFSNESDRF